MHISSVLIRDLRALRSREDDLRVDGERGASWCLQGLNGAGKTTWLEAVAQLWQWFSRCARRGAWTRPEGSPLLQEAGLVAMRVEDLPGPIPSLWIAWGSDPILRGFLTEHGDKALSWGATGPQWDRELLTWWSTAFLENELGREQHPNVVWIQAENKSVPELRRAELERPPEGPVFPSVARYLPQARGASHLEGLIGALHGAWRHDRYRQLQEEVALLFPGLSLCDDLTPTRRPALELRLPGAPPVTGLTIDRLSAGQRSMLINLAMVLRWSGRGAVVLWDEPELHAHISMMRGSVAVMESLITRNGGQLLVASHAPEVWDHFRAKGTLIDLGRPSGVS
jgi:predicted ATPase